MNGFLALCRQQFQLRTEKNKYGQSLQHGDHLSGIAFAWSSIQHVFIAA